MRPWLFVLLSCFFIAVPRSALSQEFTGREHAHAMLLLSQSDKDVHLAAWSLYHLGSNRQDIFDLLAEVTWTVCSGNRVMDLDTLSWFGKALGKTKQPRYAELLDFCLSKVKDEKTKKYLKQARDGLGDTTTNSFAGGKMDLQQTLARLMKQASLTSRNQIEKRFDDLRRGQALEDVYSILGPPSEISAITVIGQKVGIPFGSIRIEHNRLVIGYSELGTIRFSLREGHTDWKVTDAKSSRGLFWSTIDGRFLSIVDQIAGGDGPHLRELAEQLMEQTAFEKDILDRVAERIYKSRQEEEGQLVDALAWLCKVVAKSGDGRYKRLMLDVSNTAAKRTLRKYADKAANDLPVTSGDPFIPTSN